MAPQTRRVPRPSPKKTIRSTPARSATPRRSNAKAGAAPPLSKLDTIVAALRSKRGASITELMALTGWQMHSVRGALAGALKKKRGLDIRSEKTDGERRYRIGGGA